MKKIYFIYKYEWDDGSVYIGQTYHGSGRFGKISDYKQSKKAYRKMIKHPNFEKSIIEDNLQECDVDRFEIYYIWLYNSYSKLNPEFGLNLTYGGQGVHGISAWNKGKKCPQISKVRMGIPPWNKGKHTGNRSNHDAVVKRNIEMSKKVYINGIYSGTVSELKDKLGIPARTIRERCKYHYKGYSYEYLQ